MKKILIVDDDKSNLKLHTTILGCYGYLFVAYANPLEAINHFKNSPNDFWLLITDAVMPEMHGNELIDEVLSVRPDILIIMISGFTERAIHEKIDQFIEKPINHGKLKDVIEELKQKAGGSA